MNTFFVKNREVAFSLDKNAKETTKRYWMCCSLCDDDSPVETQEGWLVKTLFTRKELQAKGIMVSHKDDRSVSDRN